MMGGGRRLGPWNTIEHGKKRDWLDGERKRGGLKRRVAERGGGGRRSPKKIKR